MHFKYTYNFSQFLLSTDSSHIQLIIFIKIQSDSSNLKKTSTYSIVEPWTLGSELNTQFLTLSCNSVVKKSKPAEYETFLQKVSSVKSCAKYSKCIGDLETLIENSFSYLTQKLFPAQVNTSTCQEPVAQSICTHYSCIENQGRFVTLKKIGHPAFFKNQGARFFFRVTNRPWFSKQEQWVQIDWRSRFSADLIFSHA